MPKLRPLILLLLLVGLGLYPNQAPIATGAMAHSALGQTKLLLPQSANNQRQQVQQAGGRLLVEYPSMSLWQVPDQQLARLDSAVLNFARPDFDQLALRGLTLDTRQAQTELNIPQHLRQTRSAGEQYWLVQFIGPVKDQWLEQLTAIGLEISIAMPQNGFLVWGDAAELAALDQLATTSPIIQWTGAYHPMYRLAPSLRDLRVADQQLLDVTIQYHNGAQAEQTLALIQQQASQIYWQPSTILRFKTLSAQLPVAALHTLAQRPDIYNLEPWVAPEMLDEAQNQIMAGNIVQQNGKIEPSGPGYLAWLASKGFPTDPAAYPIVDIVDSGLDAGLLTQGLHPDGYYLGNPQAAPRISYINNCTSDALGDDYGGHGSLNVGIVGGYNAAAGFPYEDANGYQFGLGVSPYGRLAATKIFTRGGRHSLARCYDQVQGIVAASYASGAHITSNSWGAGSSSDYSATSQAYDAMTRDASPQNFGNQEMLHIVAAGNSGPSLATLGAPATAKNVLTVGATENVRDQGVVDRCNWATADNADDLAQFSSRGPTLDQRAKPDLVAPGIHVQAGASQASGFHGLSVCGLPMYYPANQTLYTWSSGTSHATPAVAGAASLVYEYYGRVWKPNRIPSPAMIKAVLVNTPRYLAAPAVDAGGTLPTNHQGWGGLNLGQTFDQTSRILYDQITPLTESGTSYQFTATVTDTSKPVQISLVWTDAPGSTTGAAYINNLDLEVTINGQSYRGNVFDGAFSVSGGSADVRNNVENIFLPAGLSGQLEIRVLATAINGDGIPNNTDPTDQDFALVVYNASATSGVLLKPDLSVIDDQTGNANGVIDPGETVEITIPIHNAGASTAEAVVGELSVLSGNVTISSASVNYGNIASNTTSQGQRYVITVPLAQSCGSPIVLQQRITAANATPLNSDSRYSVGRYLSNPISTTLAYQGPSISVPDNQPSGVNLPISLNQALIIADLDVEITVEHPFVSDLAIRLLAPNGKTLILAEEDGGSGVNFTRTIFDSSAEQSITLVNETSAPFSGRYRPQESLNYLYGDQAQGVWQLNVADQTGGQDVSLALGYRLVFKTDVWQCQPTNLAVAGPTELPALSTGSFTATLASDPTGVQYAWDFGDGTFASGAAVEHRYQQAGNYQIRLTVSNAVGSISAIRLINVSGTRSIYVPLVWQQR
ncbi:MAG: S8 family serine peptidase [Chloroflexi bacterium]|nr:S8 family serine peptidase [Chloroflexota bacterium]